MPSSPTGSPTQLSIHTPQTSVVNVRAHGRLAASPMAATACATASEAAHAAIKKAVDPENLFRVNQNIAPVRIGATLRNAEPHAVEKVLNVHEPAMDT